MAIPVYAPGMPTTAVQQSAADAIISRLDGVRSDAMENRASASHLADKIVGSAPCGGEAKSERPPACCFLDTLNQIIDDIERIQKDTNEHVGRINRQF